MSKRLRLTFAYFCSMLALTVLNILFSTIPNTLSDNSTTILYTLLSQIVCMGAIPFAIAFLVKPSAEGATNSERLNSMRKDFYYKRPFNPKVWLVVIPIAILFYFFTMLVSRLFFLIIIISGYTPVAGVGTMYQGPLNLVMWIAVGALLPAVFEEFTHRGLLIDAISDRGNEVEIILLSGLLFGTMHGNIIQFFYAFIGGCIMAYLVVKTGSIFPAILLHFTNNAMDHLISYSSQTGGILGTIMDKFYDMLSNPFTLLLAAGILFANAILVFYLLTLVPKICKREPGIREKSYFGGKIMLDTYRIDGKPTLKDNMMIYAAFTMCMLQTIFTYIWGSLR
ncbi:MAG: CPBP family intramembrane metalloprotease [Clostridia bacterium]|nr:CPBP family intramembrane metalloprotease [Clostridia bacterium]